MQRLGQMMYSGSDSNESQKYANWALNPASFQSVPGEQVDWAALAQQWIIMKEAGPPPMPGDQPIAVSKKKPLKEGGEAEMDVENDKEAPPPPVWGTNDPPPPPGSEAWNWNTQQNPNWNSWNNSWAPPSVVPPPAPNISATKTPLLPTPSNNSYTEPPESGSDNAIPFGSTNSEYHSTNPPYWNNSGVSSKHIKPHNKRYSKVNVPIRTSAPLPPMALPVEPIHHPTSPPALDTAKRKQLPAWIREGLEKMEKEKLKQMEKQKEKEEKDTIVDQHKPSSQDTMEILKSTMKERQRSRFESDEENSNEDKKPKKPKIEEAAPLTHEDLMLKVRRTMTEILLNVTNRHIEAVCREELLRYTKNRKASEAASAPSGANIRGRLGLGIYGGDDSGSSSDDERDDDYHRDSRDSDDELKDTIKRKMADFQKTEREIEDKLEEAERQKAGSVSRSSSPESNDNDSQVDARNQGRKYFHHDTRQPSPQKTIHEPKSKPRSPSSSSQESDYSNNRSKTSRRSSSSDSKDSYKKSSKKRSITPEKRRTASSRWSKSPSRRSDSRKDSNGSKRDSGGGRKKSSSSRRSRSSSYSRSRRSRSSSYRKSSRRSRSRERSRRSRSSSRSRYSSRRSPSSSRSDRRRRRRSRSDSSGRGKRSHRH